VTDVADLKRAAAVAAAAEVEDGMRVGLGTGTTAAFAITALGDRAAQGLRITCVATSLETMRLAQSAGLTVLDFEALDEVDIGIDGADEIDSQLRAIKGGGGAMLREKIVAAAARRMIAIVDETKLVDRLGTRPVPVEVLPFATAFVRARLEKLGGRVEPRRTGDEPYRTDQGNAVLDCAFGPISDPGALAAAIDGIPGMLGHGLFLREIDSAYVGRAGGVLRLTRETI
jgi:ribose 5-phosphate isomerase A